MSTNDTLILKTKSTYYKVVVALFIIVTLSYSCEKPGSEKLRVCAQSRFFDETSADSLNYHDFVREMRFLNSSDKMEVDSLLLQNIQLWFPEAEYVNVIKKFSENLKGDYQGRHFNYMDARDSVAYETNLILRIREKLNATRIIVDSAKVRSNNGDLWHSQIYKTRVEFVLKWVRCKHDYTNS